MNLRSLFHIHRDPTWQAIGLYRYDQCRCGARRTTILTRGAGYPPAPGWPSCRDAHGQTLPTSGWVPSDEPPGYPEHPIPLSRGSLIPPPPQAKPACTPPGRHQ